MTATETVPHLTVKDIAAELNASPGHVRELFREVPGVILLGKGKRKSIRVPVEVYATWKMRKAVQSAPPPPPHTYNQAKRAMVSTAPRTPGNLAIIYAKRERSRV